MSKNLDNDAKAINKRIDEGEFSLYDKFLYGGIGYGYICLPKNFMRVLISLIFPPFAIVIKHLKLKDTFPYITKSGLINLLNNLSDVMYSVILTFCFWVPGVIYSFQQLKVFGMDVEDDKEKFADKYGFSDDELNEDMVREFMGKIKKRKEYSV